MKSPAPLEHVEAVLVANYLKALKRQGKILNYCHIVNEFKLGRSMMGLIQNMKSEGWMPGVPDYLIVTPSTILFLELKRVSGSVVSNDQKQWLESLQNRPGVVAVVAKGFDEAKQCISSLLTTS